MSSETNLTRSPSLPITRWELVWHIIWAMTFGASLLNSLQDALSQTTFRVGLWAGAMALTQILVIWAKQKRLPAEQWLGASLALYAVQVILWVALVLSSPFWLLHLISIFALLHLTLPRRYALSLDLFLVLGTLTQQVSLFGFTLINLTLFVVGGIGICLFGLWIYSIIQDREEKRQLIEGLRAAQAELVSAERREGVLEERSRLARDIHDTLAQGYIGVIMHLEAADEVQKDDPDKATFHLNQAGEMAREGLKQARQVVNDLRPDILEDSRDSAEALRNLLARWSEQSGIPAVFNESGTPVAIHPETELTLLRMTQEGLANILRHAHATTVRVTLSWIGDQLVLDIEDDGVGFDQTADHAPRSPDSDGGFGLTSMQERVASSGGELHIETIPTEGTTLTAILPVRGEQS